TSCPEPCRSPRFLARTSQPEKWYGSISRVGLDRLVVQGAQLDLDRLSHRAVPAPLYHPSDRDPPSPRRDRCESAHKTTAPAGPRPRSRSPCPTGQRRDRRRHEARASKCGPRHRLDTRDGARCLVVAARTVREQNRIEVLSRRIRPAASEVSPALYLIRKLL